MVTVIPPGAQVLPFCSFIIVVVKTPNYQLKFAKLILSVTQKGHSVWAVTLITRSNDCLIVSLGGRKGGKTKISNKFPTNYTTDKFRSTCNMRGRKHDIQSYIMRSQSIIKLYM